jgi:hypothetical protein
MPDKVKKTTTGDPLLEEARERLKACIDEESTERAKMEDDLAFCTLDQWDANVRRERENDPNGPRPCLTIDKINQYIVQVVNDMRQNRPSIKTRPVDDSADPETAEIFQGLVRHIEDQSSASVAYETAGEWAVKTGLGYFRVVTEYADDDTSNQNICIKRIPNAFNVYLGPHDMPDGSDAEFGFVFEDLPIATFKRLYPSAKTNKEDFEDLGDTLSWRTEDTIRVCEYFYADYEKIPEADLEDGSKRNLSKKTIRWCKFTGAEIIDKRDWAGKYIPIVEVVGRESFVKGKRVLWGLVRPAKDSLRMNNYWMSAITEKIGLAPKVPFIGAEGQFEGREAEWRNANRENRAFLQYKPIDVNGNALPPPQRVAPAPVEAAMIQMTALIERDVKASLGMYKAAVGDTDPQQSGRAILALQRESDTGTFHFADNLSRSIRHCGRIIVDLIPKIYDTRRVVRILGDDGESQPVQIDPSQPGAVERIQGTDGKVKSIYNLGVGTYDVTVTVGPSYNTRRMEAAEAMLKITEGKPEVLMMIGDLMFKSMDWPMADQIAERFKRALPPQLQDPKEGQAPIPPQAQQQMMQMQKMLQMAGQKIQELESGEKQAQAKIAVQAQESQAKLALQEKEAEREAQLTVYKAQLDAKTKVAIAQIQAKGSHDEKLIETETQQNIAFMQGENEKEISANESANEALAGESSEASGAAETGGGAAPAPSLRDVLTGLAQVIGQMAQQNAQMMMMHQNAMQGLAQTMNRPKQVSLQRDAEGRPVGATVQ